MRDFPFWRDSLTNAKTQSALKSVGEELAAFQKQTDFLGGEPKLTEAQVDSLRMIYSLRLKKFTTERLQP